MDGTRLTKLAVQLVEPALIRQLAIPQEVRYLLKGHILREVADFVATVEQYAFLPVNKREFSFERKDAFEAFY